MSNHSIVPEQNTTTPAWDAPVGHAASNVFVSKA
jgi:hypothetical protein